MVGGMRAIDHPSPIARPFRTTTMHRPASVQGRICAILALLVLSGTAKARLGDTYEQLVKRYGAPVSRSKDTWDFERNGIDVSARMFEGRCFRMHCWRKGGLTTEQAFAIINASCAGPVTWVSRDTKPRDDDVMPVHNFQSSDGRIQASYFGEHVILIVPAVQAKANAEAK
jgi:hypothetical protein